MAVCEAAEACARAKGHTRLSIDIALAGIEKLDKKQENFRGLLREKDAIRRRIKSIKKQLQEVSDQIGRDNPCV